MELVLDANILVAAFLRFATTRELLLDERLTFYAPEYSVAETEKVLVSPRLRQRFGQLSATCSARGGCTLLGISYASANPIVVQRCGFESTADGTGLRYSRTSGFSSFLSLFGEGA